MIDRVPPAALDSERAFLGSCLIEPEAYISGTDVNLLPDDFTRAEHRHVWDAILKLADKKVCIDIVTVHEWLDTNGWGESVPPTYLSDLARASVMSMNAAHYARIIKDKAVRRSLLKAAGRISELGYSEDIDVESLMDMAEVALRAARDTAPGPSRDPSPASILLRMEGDKFQGIPTRLPALNAVTTGMVRGHLWVCGGFSSTGKSAFAVNLAEDAVNSGGAVMVASTEMSQEQYLLRLMSLTSGVPQRLIRHGGMTLEQGATYETAKKSWRTAKLRVYDDLYNITRIRRAARKMKETIGLDVLFVDFVQNLNDSGDEVKDARLAAIELQSLAKELQCCVVGLSQLSNSMAFQQATEGINANYYQFKGSGALKDAADIGIMLDRDRNNHPDVMWVHVVKNRHDKLVRIGCRFELETGKLTQLDDATAASVDPNAGRPSKKGRQDDGTYTSVSSDATKGRRDAEDKGWSAR